MRGGGRERQSGKWRWRRRGTERDIKERRVRKGGRVGEGKGDERRDERKKRERERDRKRERKREWERGRKREGQRKDGEGGSLWGKAVKLGGRGRR